MSSDHFSPWSERQGESGFAWSWLGAAMRVTGLPFGVVNAPGQRYHPAIVAQAPRRRARCRPDGCGKTPGEVVAELLRDADRSAD